MTVGVQGGHFLGGQEAVDDAHVRAFEDAVVMGVEVGQGGSQGETQLRVAFAQHGEGFQNVQAAADVKVLGDLTPGVNEEQMDFIAVAVAVALPARRDFDAERRVEDLAPDGVAAEQRGDKVGRGADVRDDPLALSRFQQRLHDREVRRLGNAQAARPAVLHERIKERCRIFYFDDPRVLAERVGHGGEEHGAAVRGEQKLRAEVTRLDEAPHGPRAGAAKQQQHSKAGEGAEKAHPVEQRHVGSVAKQGDGESRQRRGRRRGPE